MQVLQLQVVAVAVAEEVVGAEVEVEVEVGAEVDMVAAAAMAMVEKVAGADQVAVPLATINVNKTRSPAKPAPRTMSTTAAGVETSVHPTPAVLPHAPGAPAGPSVLQDSRTAIPTQRMDVKQMLTTMP